METVLLANILQMDIERNIGLHIGVVTNKCTLGQQDDHGGVTTLM